MYAKYISRILYLHLVLLSQAWQKECDDGWLPNVFVQHKVMINGTGNHSFRKELLGGFLDEERNNLWVLFSSRSVFHFSFFWFELWIFLLHLQVWKILNWDIQLLFCSVTGFLRPVSCLLKSIHRDRSRSRRWCPGQPNFCRSVYCNAY